MKGKAVTLAGYLLAEIDKRRKRDDSGQFESYTKTICRELSIKYIPLGIKRKKYPGRNSGVPRRFDVRRVSHGEES